MNNVSIEEKILEDLFKVYLSAIDSYNSKILQIINEKYTIIDKSALAVYLFIKILEDRKVHEKIAEKVLENYVLKQIIYGETGNLALEITDKSKVELYNKVINELIVEKFEYKNRILTHLKYNYEIIESNEYTRLLSFCEQVSELAILNKLSIRGNLEAREYFETQKQKFINLEIETLDEFKKEKELIIDLIKNNKFQNTEYCNLLEVALNLRDVYRYSTLTTVLPENVLFHQFTMAMSSIIFAQYLNNEMGENIDIYKIIVYSLFHDFGEYKGNEIVTQVKNYNEDTIKMFKEMEIADEKELREKLGDNIYKIIVDFDGIGEEYVSELLDKMFGIMKLWIELGYMGNNQYSKSICSIFQARFKRFKKVEKIDSLKNKEFYLDLVRVCYIYVKEHLINYDLDMFFKYFTEEELEEYRKELKEIKENKKLFLK